MTFHQKLGMILENKVVQELKIENIVFTKTFCGHKKTIVGSALKSLHKIKAKKYLKNIGIYVHILS